MKQFEKRLRALESAAQPQRPEEQRGGRLAKIHTAIAICFALRRGGRAKEELEAEDTSLDPGRRAELTKRLEGARSIASALAKYSPGKETPPSARAVIPGSLDALLVALI